MKKEQRRWRRENGNSLKSKFKGHSGEVISGRKGIDDRTAELGVTLF